MKNKTQIGSLGEEIAASYLKKNNYKIIERNFKKRYGEIDIIAIHTDTLVFIEVKTRNSDEFGTPLEAITYRKLSILIKTAQFYKLSHPKLPDRLRIDAIAINLFEDNNAKKIEHVKNITDF